MLAGCLGGGQSGDNNQSEPTAGNGTSEGNTAGNGTSEGNTAGNGTPAPDEVQMGGSLRIAMQSDIDQTLHPHKAPDTTAITMVENLGNSLVRADPNGEIKPDLATDWEISDDNLTYTFTLREGVKFQKPYDTEVTAEDVVWNWRKILDADYGAFGRGAFAGILTGEEIDPENTVQKTGEYEVTFNLAEPMAPFLKKQASMTAFGWYTIIPREALEEHGDNFGGLDTGVWATGPFKYNPEKSKVGSEYVFDKNPQYFRETEAGQLPYLDGVTYTVAPESSTRVTGLKTGQIDVSESVPPTDVESIKNSEDASVYSVPSTAKTSMWPNIRNHEPLSMKKVRKALLYATNRQPMIETVFDGNGAVAHSPLPPWHPYYNKDASVVYNQDVGKAKKLLEEAGYGDGFSFKCEPTNQPKFVDPAKIMQQQLRAVNIDMSISPVSKGTAFNPIDSCSWDNLENCPSSDWNSLIDNFTWGFAAADYTYSTFHSRADFNWTYYSSEKVDQLTEKARSTLDQKKRQDIYNDIQQAITDDQPQPFLLWNAFTPGYRDRVNNFRAWPTAYLWLEDVWAEEN